MPKRFNFKRMIGRPFMKDIVHPLVGVARPFVNQALGALKAKGLDMAKDAGTRLLRTATEMQIPVFRTGGHVGKGGKKGKARLAVVHNGEYVLPVCVKPTAIKNLRLLKEKLVLKNK